MILSVLMEKVYGKAFDVIVQEEINEKLGLMNTKFKGLDESRVVTNEPGYVIHDTKARTALKLGMAVRACGDFNYC